MVAWLFSRAKLSCFPCKIQRGLNLNYLQSRYLVNIKLKWVKDKDLDTVVSAEKDLKAVCFLVSIISSSSEHCLPIYHLHPHRRQLGLPNDVKMSTFIRRYPSIFHESHILDSAGTRVPSFCLTPEARELHEEEIVVLRQCSKDLRSRLCRLLMLTNGCTLPLQTIDQLRWDMGLPYDYQNSFIPYNYDLFSFIRLPDDRIGLKLLSWDNDLAISELQKNAASQQMKEDIRNGYLPFPIGFTRGFGLKRKCMDWLKEWQKLPYTSPYCDASHLDPRTDASEKRIVGVFHELLHLTLQKKTERKNVSNLRKPFSMPQKFTKVFERHPGIFYISKKGDTQTVILREAYDGDKLLQKHPLVSIRERFTSMLRKGQLDRSRGLYKKEDPFGHFHHDEVDETQYSSEEVSDHNFLSEYDSESDGLVDNC
ncbi:protein WHAT'S THIS FACTOR 9, mitochondrial [Benincasa hispida]|uniref:protein WHAT'S THIS FACTOR 9, mitochondrial n=1 Tax=Benincasa hispida TaxID=102211 RepID=UPI0019006F2C|nr:protein WHAT'S THIS FACTOR 9, mitochondrial [Benincasa hispida]XP_038886286.1 protein WHAT'S THIS FACTOR 9, mitochondrial [Benincasa hispida]